MGDWLGLEWWKSVWIPAFAAGSVWLASRWKASSDDRASRDARLDTRQDKELARLDAEAEELREDRDRGWGLARWWWGHCHDQRHLANNRIMRLGGTSEDRLPELPGLEDPISKPRT
jgi:hypothetical protein